WLRLGTTSISVFPPLLPFSRSGYDLHLHSFPTRRSSDLNFGYTYIMRPNSEGANYNIGSPTVTDCSYPNVNRYTFKFTAPWSTRDRKSTRLNSSHVSISYAVFCLTITNLSLL